MFFHILQPLLVAALIVFFFTVLYITIWGGHNSRVKKLKNQTNKK